MALLQTRQVSGISPYEATRAFFLGIEIDEDENVNNNWEEALVDETIKEIDDLFKILETTDDK